MLLRLIKPPYFGINISQVHFAVGLVKLCPNNGLKDVECVLIGIFRLCKRPVCL